MSPARRGRLPGRSIALLGGCELSTAQRKLAKKEQELERLVDAQNVLIGMLAHDLRSPLTAIGGCASLLQDDGNLTTEQLELLVSIEKACNNMSRLVGETLDWTKLESSKLVLNRAPTDLNALVEKALTVQRIIAGRRSIGITFTSDDSLPQAPVDPLRLQQVIDNLLSNAIRFSPSGSEIRVGLERVDGTVLLTVRDRGEGIDPGCVSAIFEPFSASAEGQDRAGYGLGLAIVKRIVELHEGSVVLRIEPDGGTRAEVRLRLHG